MNLFESCSNTSSWAEKKSKYQRRKLHMMNFLKDSYERKLAAIEASIQKLEEQITNSAAE